jgi:hypothetical protein
MKPTALNAWLIALLLVFIAGCGVFDSGPAATLKAFYKEVETGKLTEASDRLTGPAVQMMGKDKLKAGLARQSEKFKQKGGLKSIEIKSEEINGEAATVVALLTFGDGSTVPDDKTMFVKGDKGWLILAQ